MEVHVPTKSPAHVHGCPVHPGGTDAGIGYDEVWTATVPPDVPVLVSRKPVRRSDACYWDADHYALFKTTYWPLYDAAVKAVS